MKKNPVFVACEAVAKSWKLSKFSLSGEVLQVFASDFALRVFGDFSALDISDPEESAEALPKLFKLEGFCRNPIEIKGTAFPARILVEAMEKMRVAADAENTRYSLGGVFWDGDAIVATDGRRLHWTTVGKVEPLPGEEEPPEGFLLTRIIPVEGVKLLKKIAKAFGDDILRVYFTHSECVFSGDHWEFRVQLLQGRFPNWREVVQLRDKEIETIRENRKEIIGLCEESIQIARLKKDSVPKIKLKTSETGVDVLVNAKYLIDALKTSARETVEIACTIAAKQNKRFGFQLLQKAELSHEVGFTLMAMEP